MKGIVTLVAAVALMNSSIAFSATIQCNASDEINHMKIDSTQVSACLDSGVGNLTGEDHNDLFLLGVGHDYTSAGKLNDNGSGYNPFSISFTEGGSEPLTGSWGFDSSFWDYTSTGAIAFKFGTGDTADEWFVFSLVNGQTSGTWDFFKVLGNGNGTGGLSHVNLYAVTAVPLPAAVWLFGSALISFAGFSRYRKK